MLSGYNGNNAVAQTNSVKYEQVIKSKPLTKVLKELEVRFNTKIVFSYDDLASYKVNAKVKANTVNEALNQVLVGLPISYTISNGIISVKISTSPNSGKVRISGKVFDAQGEPIPAATVALQGKKGVGTVTDNNGNFSINLDKGNGETLLFSYLGMNTTTYYVNCRKDINNVSIILDDDKKLIDEVVVIGYGTAKAKDLTGSVARLSEKDVENAPMTSNIASMIQGKAAGVNVMISNASPTSPISLVIRGQSSLSGDGQPLWVIDGVPQYSTSISGDVSNTLYNLDLNDVQSIDILKDASATAIYGSRAANGVVIVTTKRGKKGKAQITYNGSISRTIDGIQPPITTNAEWLDMFFEAQYNDARAVRPNLTDPRDIYQNMDWWIFNSFGGPTLDESDIDPETGAPTIYRGYKLFNALRSGQILTLRNGTKVEHQDSECMAAGVESQLIAYAKHHSKGMHIKIDVFLLTQWKNRLAVVRGIVERKNLPGYRMEWHEELHACLLSFLADELSYLSKKMTIIVLYQQIIVRG